MVELLVLLLVLFLLFVASGPLSEARVQLFY